MRNLGIIWEWLPTPSSSCLFVYFDSLHLLAVRANVKLFRIFIRVRKNLLACEWWIIDTILLHLLLLLLRLLPRDAVVRDLLVQHHHGRVLLEEGLRGRRWLVHVCLIRCVWHVLALIERAVLAALPSDALTTTSVGLIDLIVNGSSTLYHGQLAPLNESETY